MARKRLPKLTCDADEEFLNQVRDVVVWLQCGPERGMTIQSFMTSAVKDKIAKVKKKYRDLLVDGKIPSRNDVEPQRGRRIS